MNRDNVSLLNRVRIKAVHFAWDNPDEDLTGYFQRFLDLTAIKSSRQRRVYVLTNYGSTHEQDLYRVNTLRAMGFDPYVMIYERPTAPPVTRHLQRTVPKDLTKIKSKVMFNLTKRQLICFSAAVAIGLPLFFLVKGSVGTSAAALCMVLAMLPMFLLAMYEKNGQPLEVIIRQFVEVKFLRPKERPYQTNNFYAALARQEQLDKEVRAIVKGKEKHPKRKA